MTLILNPLELAAYAGRLAGGACSALLTFLDNPVDADDDFDEAAAERFLHDDAVRRGLGPITSAANGEAPSACAHPAELPAPPDLPRAGGAGHHQLTAQDLRDARFACESRRDATDPHQAPSTWNRWHGLALRLGAAANQTSQ